MAVTLLRMHAPASPAGAVQRRDAAAGGARPPDPRRGARRRGHRGRPALPRPRAREGAASRSTAADAVRSPARTRRARLARSSATSDRGIVHRRSPGTADGSSRARCSSHFGDRPRDSSDTSGRFPDRYVGRPSYLARSRSGGTSPGRGRWCGTGTGRRCSDRAPPFARRRPWSLNVEPTSPRTRRVRSAVRRFCSGMKLAITVTGPRRAWCRTSRTRQTSVLSTTRSPAVLAEISGASRRPERHGSLPRSVETSRWTRSRRGRPRRARSTRGRPCRVDGLDVRPTTGVCALSPLSSGPLRRYRPAPGRRHLSTVAPVAAAPAPCRDR